MSQRGVSTTKYQLHVGFVLLCVFMATRLGFSLPHESIFAACRYWLPYQMKRELSKRRAIQAVAEKGDWFAKSHGQAMRAVWILLRNAIHRGSATESPPTTQLSIFRRTRISYLPAGGIGSDLQSCFRILTRRSTCRRLIVYLVKGCSRWAKHTLLRP